MIQRKSLIIWPYFLMLFVGLTFPSDGQHGLLSAKSLSFLTALLALGGYLMIRQKIYLEQLKYLLFFLAALAILSVWLSVSLLHGETTQTSQMDQFKLFVITLLFPLASLFLIKENLITPQQIVKVALYSNFCYILLKISMVFLYAFNIIDLWSMLEAFGIRFMRMNIYGGIERIQTSVDIVTPYLLLFVLQSDNLSVSLSPRFKRLFVILSLLSTFLSFSRMLIGVYFLSCCLHWSTQRPGKIARVLLAILAVCFCAYLAIGPEKVNHVIERRLYSKDNTESDSARVQQMNALFCEFDQYPLFGKGIGGFSKHCVRDYQLLHNYEVQWVAFLMQFGILGILLLLTPLVWIGFQLINAPFTRTRWAFLGLFCLWLLAGFTNPFLISLASGIMYTLFYIASTNLVVKNKHPYLK